MTACGHSLRYWHNSESARLLVESKLCWVWGSWDPNCPNSFISCHTLWQIESPVWSSHFLCSPNILSPFRMQRLLIMSLVVDQSLVRYHIAFTHDHFYPLDVPNSKSSKQPQHNGCGKSFLSNVDSWSFHSPGQHTSYVHWISADHVGAVCQTIFQALIPAWTLMCCHLELCTQSLHAQNFLSFQFPCNGRCSLSVAISFHGISFEKRQKTLGATSYNMKI